MSSFLIELWSIENWSIDGQLSLCSSFVKYFDIFPKQKLNQLMLSFALNL